jgi:hypothetical protein
LVLAARDHHGPKQMSGPDVCITPKVASSNVDLLARPGVGPLALPDGPRPQRGRWTPLTATLWNDRLDRPPDAWAGIGWNLAVVRVVGELRVPLA